MPQATRRGRAPAKRLARLEARWQGPGLSDRWRERPRRGPGKDTFGRRLPRPPARRRYCQITALPEVPSTSPAAPALREGSERAYAVATATRRRRLCLTVWNPVPFPE